MALGRSPGADEIDYWSGVIATDGNAAFVISVMDSPEAQQVARERAAKDQAIEAPSASWGRIVAAQDAHIDFLRREVDAQPVVMALGAIARVLMPDALMKRLIASDALDLRNHQERPDLAIIADSEVPASATSGVSTLVLLYDQSTVLNALAEPHYRFDAGESLDLRLSKVDEAFQHDDACRGPVFWLFKGENLRQTFFCPAVFFEAKNHKSQDPRARARRIVITMIAHHFLVGHSRQLDLDLDRWDRDMGTSIARRYHVIQYLRG